MFNCTCTRHIDWTTQTPSCIRQLRILSGLLCDKPWCNPIVLTTVAVGLGKKADNLFSVNCQHLCSIVQPPFRHFSFPSPHPSSRFSFWPRLTEFWPGWDDVLRISTIYPYQSISIIPKQSQYVSNILKYFCPGVDCGNLPSPCFHPRPQSSPSCLWHHDSRPGLQQNFSCQPSNICSMTTICKSLVFWHFMKACFWLKLTTLWQLIFLYSSKGVFAMLGPPLAGALVEAAGHRGPALQVHQIFLRIC